jgi:hypothetical protein
MTWRIHEKKDTSGEKAARELGREEPASRTAKIQQGGSGRAWLGSRSDNTVKIIEVAVTRRMHEVRE